MKTRNRGKTMSQNSEDLDFPVGNKRSLRNCRLDKAKESRKSKRLCSFKTINHGQLPLINQSKAISPVKKNNKSPKGKKKVKVEEPVVAEPSDLCNFCNTEAADVYLLGEVKKCEDITAHMYCLFFAPGLTQNGELDEGIDGFRLSDIRKELKRGTHLKCSYCHKRGAVVGCAKSSCEINYHLPCGIENGTFNHFHDEGNSFPSWCEKHRPKQNIPAFKGRQICTICQEYMKNHERDLSLFVSCCKSYYHRDCLANLSHHQGVYHLRCPNCKNENDFQKMLKSGGINVPCRDATYELTGELNSDDIVFECNAEACLCDNGRRFNGENEWELFACDRCGSEAVHVSCAGLANDDTEWMCHVCSAVQ